jgi:hypothetical protein
MAFLGRPVLIASDHGYNGLMDRRFQFSLRALLGQVTLVAIGLCCLLSIGEHAGPFVSACLMEGAAAALGGIVGLLAGKPRVFAVVAAVLMLPLACFVFVLVEGIGC